MSRRNYGWLRRGRDWPDVARQRKPWLARYANYASHYPVRHRKRKG